MSADPKDPRFIRYRGAMYGLFIAVCSVVALAITVSVVRSVWRMSPGLLPEAEPTLTVKECLDRADALWNELDARRQALAQATPVKGSEGAWYAFRVDWLGRFRAAQAQCALESHAREPVKKVYAALLGLIDAYTTGAVQYTGQLGGAVDGFKRSLAAARADSSTAGRF